ncbi:ATP phosphoribosyltransferase [Epilithonimonas hungarica]|uniref:ATP phosphoribosyltransferase n=1 Tax=Epilithonimonas hungarica TaxID=454006 RepID=UPI0027856939|nr:ATP phosphoribosyltransferase [Epilithonimonas hungarica]MDP9956704.1 ATP phosphoribosyltransferase [Epilithonimonas hungarica]
MSKLKLALQKSGRLSEKSLKLLEECGIKISNGTRKLKAVSSNFPLEILFLRDDDIPQYVEQGVADIGILGLNEVLEQKKQIETIQKLGFAQCRLSLAIPKEESYNGIQYFEGKKIATSYPEILSNYFQEKKINAQIEKIGGSVEIAPGIGLSDAIFDIISTGSTLLTNGLKEVETVVESEAVLVSNNDLSEDKKDILKKLLFRINAVKEASESKYILLNTPNENLGKIINILPGMKSPTVLPLAESGWSSIHSVIKEDQFWEVIEKLKNEGAQGILVLEIEKMIL